MSPSVLDLPETYDRLDPEGLYGRIAGLPDQIEEAWRAAARLALPPDYRDVDAVAVLGMGGSGIGGAILQALAIDTGARVPVFVVRGYVLPRWVGPRTLVLASSNSGNTEEVLATTAAAVAAGARCIAITTGGRLLDLARDHRLPALTFAWDGEPRSALGWSTISLLAICGGLGLIPDLVPDLPGALAAMRRVLDEIAGEVPESANPAKQLARRLAGALPVFVGAQALGPVAYRWRTQFNENAKSWAVAEELPEMNHNAPLGFGAPAALLPLLRVVVLRHAAMHPRIALRVDATQRQLADAGVRAEVLHVPGESVLARVLWAVQMGDLTSYYAGLLHGVHPSPVGALDWLKRYMADR
ncbi:MAG TPA: bifunctional phosphoglucose/phosphomannose isomerase [Dehalococcoidia bacterium]|nr:bifunctional phosphoglucose/phosphomannose isomerase [Dehalococcoidia bacterium]